MSKELTPLQAFNKIDVDTKNNYVDEFIIIQKSLKALEEIIVLHNEWLAHQKSDFEFFTLFNEIVCKYELLKEIL